MSSLADSIESAQVFRAMIDGVGYPCIMSLEIGTVAVVCGCCVAHVLDLNSTVLMFRTLCIEHCQLLALLARWLSRHWPLGTCVHMCKPCRVHYTTLDAHCCLCRNLVQTALLRHHARVCAGIVWMIAHSEFGVFWSQAREWFSCGALFLLACLGNNCCRLQVFL
jgi:hypothetical protein